MPVQRRKFNLRELAAQGSTHPTFPVKINSTFAGMRITIRVSALTGTSLTFTLNMVDPADGVTLLSLGATAAVTGAGVHVITVHPAVTTAAAASGFTAVGTLAPYKWQLVVSGTVSAATWSAVVEYFNS